ncbi:MAG: glycosyltransferase family 4 protein [Methylophilaceae bacterium]
MTAPKPKPKLLFVVTEGRYFVSHRLPLAIGASAAGFDVAVATRADGQEERIKSAGIRLVPFTLTRRTGNPLQEIWALYQLYRCEKPDLVHHVALKAVIYGSFAARLAHVPAQVNAVTGLGWLFISANYAIRFIRRLLRFWLAYSLGKHSLIIVQNPEDSALLQRSGVAAQKLRLIRGSGVDTQLFYPMNTQPPEPVCIVLAARMLWDKGVGEFVAAAENLAGQGIHARFLLVGEPDPSNPASVPEATLKAWHSRFGVEYWGHRDDMPDVLNNAHIACLPSYREGLPKSLLEAAACGLPIVASDVPGCREVVQNGVNGFLVPVKESAALAAALMRLIVDADLRRNMGLQSRSLVLAEFSQEMVVIETIAVYQELIG